MGDNVVTICHSSPKSTVMWPTLITFNFSGALFSCQTIITQSNLFIVTCMYDTIGSVRILNKKRSCISIMSHNKLVKQI